MLNPHSLTGAISRSVFFLEQDLFIWFGLFEFFRCRVVGKREGGIWNGGGLGWDLAWRRVIMGERRHE